MLHVVQSECMNCKYGDCVEVCPVNCFFEGDRMMFINPLECIECDACVDICPVGAIVPEGEAQEKWKQKNENFNFKEEYRRGAKENVSHGSDWNQELAG